MKRTAGLMLVLSLACWLLVACGGEEQQGVELQAVRVRVTSTPPPIASVTATPAQNAGFILTGRLLYLKGRTFEMLDLTSGATTTLSDPVAYSTVEFNPGARQGVFVAFPDFGVLDLATYTVTIIDNPRSNPTALALSPDGQWLATQTGTLRTQVMLLPTDGSAPVNVTGGGTFFNFTWLVDGRLAWWDSQNPDAVMIFDPANGESTPADPAALLDFVAVPGGVISPDGTRAAVINTPFVPGAFGGNGGDGDAVECPPDSAVQLLTLPVPAAQAQRQFETVWAEAGLIAASPQWVDTDTLLYVHLGTGACGEFQSEPVRQIMQLDLDGSAPRPVAGPLGNADDPNDEAQNFGRQVGHLYAPSPDGLYVAWVGGGRSAGETVIHITRLETGETHTVLRFSEDEALGAADYIEEYLIRQVIWLE